MLVIAFVLPVSFASWLQLPLTVLSICMRTINATFSLAHRSSHDFPAKSVQTKQTLLGQFLAPLLCSAFSLFLSSSCATQNEQGRSKLSRVRIRLRLTVFVNPLLRDTRSGCDINYQTRRTHFPLFSGHLRLLSFAWIFNGQRSDTSVAFHSVFYSVSI